MLDLFTTLAPATLALFSARGTLPDTSSEPYDLSNYDNDEIVAFLDRFEPSPEQMMPYLVLLDQCMSKDGLQCAGAFAYAQLLCNPSLNWSIYYFRALFVRVLLSFKYLEQQMSSDKQESLLRACKQVIDRDPDENQVEHLYLVFDDIPANVFPLFLTLFDSFVDVHAHAFLGRCISSLSQGAAPAAPIFSYVHLKCSSDRTVFYQHLIYAISSGTSLSDTAKHMVPLFDQSTVTTDRFSKFLVSAIKSPTGSRRIVMLDFCYVLLEHLFTHPKDGLVTDVEQLASRLYLTSLGRTRDKVMRVRCKAHSLCALLSAHVSSELRTSLDKVFAHWGAAHTQERVSILSHGRALLEYDASNADRQLEGILRLFFALPASELEAHKRLCDALYEFLSPILPYPQYSDAVVRLLSLMDSHFAEVFVDDKRPSRFVDVHVLAHARSYERAFQRFFARSAAEFEFDNEAPSSYEIFLAYNFAAVRKGAPLAPAVLVQHIMNSDDYATRCLMQYPDDLLRQSIPSASFAGLSPENVFDWYSPTRLAFALRTFESDRTFLQTLITVVETRWSSTSLSTNSCGIVMDVASTSSHLLKRNLFPRIADQVKETLFSTHDASPLVRTFSLVAFSKFCFATGSTKALRSTLPLLQTHMDARFVQNMVVIAADSVRLDASMATFYVDVCEKVVPSGTNDVCALSLRLLTEQLRDDLVKPSARICSMLTTACTRPTVRPAAMVALDACCEKGYKRETVVLTAIQNRLGIEVYSLLIHRMRAADRFRLLTKVVDLIASACDEIEKSHVEMASVASTEDADAVRESTTDTAVAAKEGLGDYLAILGLENMDMMLLSVDDDGEPVATIREMVARGFKDRVLPVLAHAKRIVQNARSPWLKHVLDAMLRIVERAGSKGPVADWLAENPREAREIEYEARLREQAYRQKAQEMKKRRLSRDDIDQLLTPQRDISLDQSRITGTPGGSAFKTPSLKTPASLDAMRSGPATLRSSQRNVTTVVVMQPEEREEADNAVTMLRQISAQKSLSAAQREKVYAQATMEYAAGIEVEGPVEDAPPSNKVVELDLETGSEYIHPRVQDDVSMVRALEFEE